MASFLRRATSDREYSFALRLGAPRKGRVTLLERSLRQLGLYSPEGFQRQTPAIWISASDLVEGAFRSSCESSFLNDSLLLTLRAKYHTDVYHKESIPRWKGGEIEMKLPADWNESWSNREAAMYLVGHGSYTRPRLIELQYRQILRYREALAGRYEKGHSFPSVFIDFRLPRFGMGRVNLNEVPGFKKLCNAVRSHRCTLVYIDLDDTKEGLTPDYESAFVRLLLEKAGAKVLNAFSDEEDAFKRALKNRCGVHAREYEVTDSSDIVCFFPSLASDIVATSLRRELQDPTPAGGQLQRVNDRIEALKRLRPYAGGGRPFIEDRLSSEWQKPGKGEAPMTVAE